MAAMGRISGAGAGEEGRLEGPVRPGGRRAGPG